MSAPVVWFEVIGQDADKLRKFYGDMFAWDFDVMEAMNYGMVDKGDEGIPGGIGAAPPKAPGWSTFYVKVSDIEAAVSKAESLGGKTLMPVTPLPNKDLVAVVTDPEGHPVGLVTVN